MWDQSDISATTAKNFTQTSENMLLDYINYVKKCSVQKTNLGNWWSYFKYEQQILQLTLSTQIILHWHSVSTFLNLHLRMATTKIIYSHDETELVTPNCFPSYQQMEEAVQNIKRAVPAQTCTL